MLISQVLNFDSAAEIRQIAKGLQKGFLRHILRLGLVFHEGHRHAVNAEFVRLDEPVVQLPVSRQNGGNHLCLVPLRRAGISYGHARFLRRIAIVASGERKPV